ncbi:hypothetical protein C2G38_2243987 [Gigaspora rosea]|uniref:Uncharacterized protein n=1 Tax=Gigaspora rosea TaxID=44941 RepID=A0A397VFW5_9GLOM|nr:hypothetical protein C2G38_2243987 [Gigaspora rosea]
MATLAATLVAKSKSCTNGERSPQAISHQRRNFTTRNDDNDGKKFTTNQRRNQPPTTAISTAKSKSIINDTERLHERQFTTCEGSTKLQQHKPNRSNNPYLERRIKKKR